MQIPQSFRTLYVDVDGTLLLWHPDTPGKVRSLKTPRINTILVKAIRQWYLPTHTLVIWSATSQGHAEYAATITKLDTLNPPPICLKKPDAMVDDNFSWFNKRPRIEI